MNVCVYIYIYVYMCLCMYMYIYIDESIHGAARQRDHGPHALLGSILSQPKGSVASLRRSSKGPLDPVTRDPLCRGLKNDQSYVRFYPHISGISTGPQDHPGFPTCCCSFPRVVLGGRANREREQVPNSQLLLLRLLSIPNGNFQKLGGVPTTDFFSSR